MPPKSGRRNDLRITLDTTRFHDKATVLQSIYRGIRVRSWMAHRKECAEIIQRSFRRYQGKILMQGLQDNILLELKNDLRNDAALQIQTYYRMFRDAKRKYSGQSGCATTAYHCHVTNCCNLCLRPYVKTETNTLPHNLLNRCAMRVQAVWRGRYARCKYRTLFTQRAAVESFQIKEEAAIIIQREYRAFHKKNVDQETKAIQRVSKFMFCYMARKLKKNLQTARNQKWDSHESLQLKTHYVIKMQSIARQIFARKHIEKLKETMIDDCITEIRREAAVTLQALFRGFLTRISIKEDKLKRIQIRKIRSNTNGYQPSRPSHPAPYHPRPRGVSFPSSFGSFTESILPHTSSNVSLASTLSQADDESTFSLDGDRVTTPQISPVCSDDSFTPGSVHSIINSLNSIRGSKNKNLSSCAASSTVSWIDQHMARLEKDLTLKKAAASRISDWFKTHRKGRPRRLRRKKDKPCWAITIVQLFARCLLSAQITNSLKENSKIHLAKQSNLLEPKCTEGVGNDKHTKEQEQEKEEKLLQQLNDRLEELEKRFQDRFQKRREIPAAIPSTTTTVTITNTQQIKQIPVVDDLDSFTLDISDECPTSTNSPPTATTTTTTTTTTTVTTTIAAELPKSFVVPRPYCRFMAENENVLTLDAVIANNSVCMHQADYHSHPYGRTSVLSLFSALATNYTLVKLTVDKAQVKDYQVDILCTALQHNSTLFNISLAFNLLTTKAAVALLQCLNVNTALKYINLEGNAIPPKMIEQLEEVLSLRRTADSTSTPPVRRSSKGTFETPSPLLPEVKSTPSLFTSIMPLSPIEAT